MHQECVYGKPFHSFCGSANETVLIKCHHLQSRLPPNISQVMGDNGAGVWLPCDTYMCMYT